MVGGERVQLTVAPESDLAAARDVLGRHADGVPQIDPAALTVEAPVTSGARRMPDIVRDLDAASLLLDDLGIRRPSLDDVFLTLTGHAAGGGQGGDELGPEARREAAHPNEPA